MLPRPAPAYSHTFYGCMGVAGMLRRCANHCLTDGGKALNSSLCIAPVALVPLCRKCPRVSEPIELLILECLQCLYSLHIAEVVVDDVQGQSKAIDGNDVHRGI